MSDPARTMPHKPTIKDRDPGSCAAIKAVILAGGRGTRLAPYTTLLPKPLVPIGGYAIVEIILRQLIAQGFADVTLTLGHMADLITDYFEDRPTLTQQLRLSCTREERPTGTAGSLARVPDLDRTFLVLNGDLLTTLDYRKLVRFHQEQNAALTIAMHRHRVKIDLGVLRVDANNRVAEYLEKPEAEHLVSMGIYVYEPHVLRYIAPDTYLDLPALVQKLIAAGESVAGYETDARWLDIGCPAHYEHAMQEFELHRSEFCANFDDTSDIAALTNVTVAAVANDNRRDRRRVAR
jgi:NDP-sugar pyrophosphorylase family protein